jgi:ketosteroid isomerase-like protein
MSNLEKIQELYGAFGRGEIEPVLAALAPDVEWMEGDIEGLPTAAPMVPRPSGRTSSRAVAS